MYSLLYLNHKLGRVIPLCWFSLNDSETVKPLVTLPFGSIQYQFIRVIRAKLGILNLPQSADIEQNSDGSISNFGISSESLTNENRHNSRTSNDFSMKLDTKLTNKYSNVKKIDNDIMSTNGDVMDIFLTVHHSNLEQSRS